MQQSTIEITTWKKISKKFHSVNDPLARVIDKISPDDSFKLYRVRYPFGEMVFKMGILNLPNAMGYFVPYTHHSIESSIREDLSYRTIPMGMSLEKNLEMFADTQDRVIPLMLFPKGTPFGIWETFDLFHSYLINLSWTLSSGTRSMFMLPKISDITSHNKLRKEFGITVTVPKSIKNHWHVYKSIINSKAFPKKWSTDVIFFSKKWFDKLTSDTEWNELQNYLYKLLWRQSMFWRFSSTFNLMWQQFVKIMENKNIKCGGYQLETLKHLVTIGVGALPCFTANTSSDDSAPFVELKEIFSKIYELEYVPTIMHPFHFNVEDKSNYGYYSMNEPTLIEGISKHRQVHNIMQFIRETKQMFDNFKHEAITGSLKIENTPIYNLISVAKFDFIHTQHDSVNGILQSNLLPKKDPDLIAVPDGCMDMPFCYSSAYLRGCIRLGL